MGRLHRHGPAAGTCAYALAALLPFILTVCFTDSWTPWAATCRAAGPPEDPEPLTGIVDTVDVVSRRPELAEALPTFVAVYDLGDRAPRVSTISDVVEEGAGVQIRRYGGLGSYSAASIRASSPAQVEVYVDGVPLRSAQWGAVDLSDLPLDSLERIEVYRGGAPIEFGTAGIGGIVNLVSRPPVDGRSMATLSAGSHGTVRIGLVRSGGSRDLGYVVSCNHLQSRGDFEYLDRHGTPENPDDDEIVTRENNDFKQTDVLIRAALPLWWGWRADLADEFFQKRSGVPGTENVHIKSVHYRVLRNTARVRLTSPRSFNGALGLMATGFRVYRRDLFFNPADEVGFSLSDTDNRSWSYGASLLATLTWHRAGQRLKLLAEERRERFVPEDENPLIGVGFTRKRTARTLSAENAAFLFGDRLELVAGYRFEEALDNYSGPVAFGGPPEPLEDPHWSGFHGTSFGARWRPHERITLKANRTRYGRFPSMIELFGASGFIEGNPELVVEEGTTADVGLRLRSERPGDGYLEATLFWCDRDELIVFLQNSQRTVKAFNLESAHVEGVELSGRLEPWRSVTASGSYTLQMTTNTGPSPTYNGKRLPYEPKHSFFVRTAWDGGAVTLWHDYRFESESYRDRANLPENLSPASHIHGVGASADLVPGALSVTLEVHNLADERIIDVEGYPLPGRTFFVTLEVMAGGGRRQGEE